MDTNQSPEKEALLRQLFGEDEDLREQALLSVAPEHRDSVRKVIDVRRDAEKVFHAMVADLGFASSHLRKDYNNQFWRRTAIRALASTVDGIIFTLKKLAISSSEMLGANLDSECTDFLREQQSASTGKRVRLPPFRDNFKRTFKVFAEVHGTTNPTDFSQPGFDDVCAMFELRHRVMHPKSFGTFSVQDNETERAGRALNWLSCELERLLSTSKEGVGKVSFTDGTRKNT